MLGGSDIEFSDNDSDGDDLLPEGNGAVGTVSVQRQKQSTDAAGIAKFSGTPAVEAPIQRLLRLRREVAEKKVEAEAAVVIQRNYRRYLARREVESLKAKVLKDEATAAAVPRRKSLGRGRQTRPGGGYFPD